MPDGLSDVVRPINQVQMIQANLLAQEVTDLELGTALLNDAVDGEMGVDSTHLVLEALEVKRRGERGTL